MGEWLPGTHRERLQEMRKAKGYSQKKVADYLGIDRATYGRMESGEIRTVNSECLIRLAELYETTTDYLLGLSNVPERTYYDVERLGLSVEAAENLISGRADPRVVNELLVNGKFMTATRMMATYFTLSVTDFLQAKAELINFSLARIEDMVSEGLIGRDADLAEMKKRMTLTGRAARHEDTDAIRMQVMSAVEDVREKMVREVADSDRARTLLNSEIMEAAWDHALSLPGIKNLPEEAKLDLVKEGIRKGIRMDGSVTGEKLEKMDGVVDGVARLLKQLYEAEKKE